MFNGKSLIFGKFTRIFILIASVTMTLALSFSCAEKSENSDLSSAAVALVTQNQSSSSATTANTSTGTCATNGFCKMFATAGAATKNAGIAGLDNNCQTDTNKPSGGGTYKALVTDGVNRKACTTANCSGGTSEHIGWVLKPNKEYRRKDGTTVIGTTTANGVFSFPLTNSVEILANLVITNGIVTGMNADWTSNASDCLDWTTNAGGNSTTFGTWDSTGSGLIGGVGTSGCSNVHMLVCVEQ
ncbi:uncharacterized protein DUF1554 [Leptospira meyeri]|uniref:Uncharacterized protein DUF1554 n=1 Tax=Leptospira meyeri TaxID=29508 RepID=A0A4R8MTM0_LEPME|nr:DUF1554 domain-containing protein [Leptospira meyeri]TDY72643.1 uncharacterized protein DUF1554 [Leptospira meyeri]